MKQEVNKAAAKKRSQERLVIASAIIVVLASILTTLYVSGFFSSLEPQDEQSYQNITFTDAVIICREQTRDAFKSSLRNQTLDDHSSRFDQTSNTYMIFFKAQMASKKNEFGFGDFFINCYVSRSRGRIASFDVYEDKESSTEAIRRNSGGLFGWPLKK